MAPERDLKQALEELNIVSFESSGITTKDDVFMALDAISAHIKDHSDEDALKKIESLKAKRREKRMSIGSIN